jgi:hypothetical protein
MGLSVSSSLKTDDDIPTFEGGVSKNPNALVTVLALEESIFRKSILIRG